MRYDPKDADAMLLPEGWYEAVILRAEDKTSKKGNAMLQVSYEVLAPGNPNGRTWIEDYFVATNAGQVSKLRKLCRAVDVPFEPGEVTPAQFQGKNLSLYVKIQKDETGNYDPKNVAARYGKAGETDAPAAGMAAQAPADDDIPF